MKIFALYFDAMLGLLQRDWRTFISYRMQFFSQIASLFLALTMFHFISHLIRVSTFRTSNAYFAYVVVGLMIVQIVQSTLSVSTSLRSELLAGTFERLLLSPFGGVAGMLSMMVFPFVSSTIISALTLILAATVFGLSVHWSTAILAIPIGMLGSGAFAAFGMLFTCSTLMFKRAVGGLGLIISGIGLVSGLYFPIALLPGSVRWLSTVQPFTPAVNLMRHVLVNTPLPGVWAQVLKLVLFVVVLLPLSILLLQVGLRWGQRRGTIIEY